jgi:4-hydroxybenzoate polyprenyltransferase
MRDAPAAQLRLAADEPMLREPAGLIASIRGLLVALRPRQWTKNGLLLAALAFTANVHRPELLTRSLIAVGLFCMLSSAGYLVNDILDVEADRQHPTKRRRPIPAGLVPIPLALLGAVALAVVALSGAVALDPRFGVLALGYVILTASYSRWLKHIVLLDVFGIAAGFVVRAAAGAVAIAVPISPWLYIATMLGALLIGLGKRRSELHALGDRAVEHRKNLQTYTIELIDQLMLIVSSAALVTYALYTFSAENMPRDHSMMLTVPVVLYGLFRYLLLARYGAVGAPEEVLLRDNALRLTVVIWAVLAVGILYVARLA